MELVLNLIWLLLAASAVTASGALNWTNQPRARRHAPWREWTAIACALVLLFFVVSLTDDLHAERTRPRRLLELPASRKLPLVRASLRRNQIISATGHRASAVMPRATPATLRQQQETQVVRRVASNFEFPCTRMRAPSVAQLFPAARRDNLEAAAPPSVNAIVTHCGLALKSFRTLQAPVPLAHGPRIMRFLPGLYAFFTATVVYCIALII